MYIIIVGLELSQSLARFGSKVVCFEMAPRLLPREDPDATVLLQQQLQDDGVVILTSVKVLKVTFDDCGSLYQSPWGLYSMFVEVNGVEQVFQGEALLNATGRSPNVHDIGLENVSLDLLATGRMFMMFVILCLD